MDLDLLIMKLWREFKETTLETLKLLLLERLLDRDDDFVEVTQGATKDVLARRYSAFTMAQAKVDAIRVIRSAKALILHIVDIDESVIHEALCSEGFCACHPDSEIIAAPRWVAVRFKLPTPTMLQIAEVPFLH